MSNTKNYSSAQRKREFYIFMILLRCILDYIYINVIATVFAYSGFQYNPDITLMVVSWIILLLTSAMLYPAYDNTSERLSNEIILVLFTISFIPYTSMLGAGALEYDFAFANFIFWILLLFLIVTKKKNKSSLQKQASGIKILQISDFQIKCLALFFTLIIGYISGKYTGFRFNFSLMNVYDLREEASENKLPTVLSYVFSWSRSVNTILLAYFIRRKEKKWVLVCFIMQLLSFGYDGSKTTVCLLLLSFIINLLPPMQMKKINQWFFRGIIFTFAICALTYAIFEDYLLTSLFVRRVLFVPLHLETCYFDFFSKNVPDFFRQSFLRHFGFVSPYNMPMAHLIADVYFGLPEMGANNGLIADAMTNFGYVGIFILPFLIYFVLKILDKSSAGLDPRIFIVVGIYSTMGFTNTFLFTILLSHGLLVVIWLLSVMKRENKEKFNSPVLINYGDVAV